MLGKRGKQNPRETPLVPVPNPGRSARWHWWCSGPGARPRAREELESLSVAEQAELALVMRRVRDGETRGDDVKALRGKVLEARARVGGAFLRVAYFRWGQDFVCLTVFKKKKNQTEPRDLARAEQRRADWLQAFGDTPPQ